jgi:hypothetical protein
LTKKKNLNLKNETKRISGLEDYQSKGIYGDDKNLNLLEVYDEIKGIEGGSDEEIGEIDEEIEGLEDNEIEGIEEEEIGEVDEEIGGVDNEVIEGIEENAKVSIAGNSGNELIS